VSSSGYPPEDVAATSERPPTAEAMGDTPPGGAAEGWDGSRYVWAVFWLGAGVMVVFALSWGQGSSSLFLFVGWLLAYLLIGWWPARIFGDARPTDTGGVVAVAVGAPLALAMVACGTYLAWILILLLLFLRGP